MLVFQFNQISGWWCHSEMGKNQRITLGERCQKRAETEGVVMLEVLRNKIWEK